MSSLLILLFCFSVFFVFVLYYEGKDIFVSIMHYFSSAVYSTALVSEFGSVIETVNDNEPLPVYSRDVTASPACFRLPDSSERSVSSLSLHTEQDMLSTTWEPANDACLGERVEQDRAFWVEFSLSFLNTQM